MSKLPAFQFYPGDWLKDPALRRCSQAARGIWVDMLCLMFECEERGVFISNGMPWSDQEIAYAIGGDVNQNLALLTELRQKGVARTRNQDGAIFSKRMVDDDRLRRLRAESGSNGGSKTQAKRKANTKQTPEYEEEKEEIKDRGSGERKNVSCETGFDQLESFKIFWADYPCKIRESMAMLAWFEICVSSETAARIRKALEKYKTHLKARPWKQPQEGQNWLHEWPDWENYVETICKKCGGKGFFLSATNYEIECECQKQLKKEIR